MKIIHKKAGKGKTRDAIKLAAKNYSYIVCIDRQNCTEIANFARKLELEIPFPITFNEFINKEYYAPGCKGGFIIDNADMLLERISNVPITCITLTKQTATCKICQKAKEISELTRCSECFTLKCKDCDCTCDSNKGNHLIENDFLP